MASWSRKRRLIYAVIVIVILAAAIGVPAFMLLYKAPTCFDGVRNGKELGVDCGGACAKLCPSAFLPPNVSWVRFKEIAPRTYNVAAYIVNPNPGVMAPNVPYKLTLYDREALPIAVVTGTASIPARRNTLAFQASVDTGTQTPLRGVLEFTGIPQWEKSDDRLDSLRVTNQAYEDDANDSSLLVTVANSSVEPIGPVTAFAILKDGEGNVLDFSKTVIDEVPGQGNRIAPFTWPVSHFGQVISIEVLLVAE